MKRWVVVVVGVVVLLGLAAASDLPGGCEHFNRMGISPDGNSVAFSLNEKGGFVVDTSSALYKLDLSACQLTRVSGDKPLATWADINDQGEILFTWRAEGPEGYAEVAVARADGTIEELTRNRTSDVVPQWLGDGKVLLASTPLLPGEEGRDEYEVVLTVLDRKGESRELVHDFYADSKKRAYWSTLPVWLGEHLAYAAGDIIEGKEEAEGKEGLEVRLYLVDLATGERKEVTTWNIPVKEPPGYLDLAFSPDGKRLVACFLPKDFEKDQEPSQLHLVDLETGKSELVKEDVNIYYPRFAPQGEGEPLRLLYLSGTGEEDKGRSLNILNLETGEARKLVSLPGKIMTAYTDWRWLAELEGAGEKTPKDRLRIYHLSDQGFIVAEVDADGSDLAVRYLDAARLRLSQVEADLRWARAVSEASGEQVSKLEEVLAEAKKVVPEGVGFLTADSVPGLPAEEGEKE